MDPQAVIHRFIRAIENNDKEEARQAARDLVQWFNRDGFVPELAPHEMEFIFGTIADLLKP